MARLGHLVFAVVDGPLVLEHLVEREISTRYRPRVGFTTCTSTTTLRLTRYTTFSFHSKLISTRMAPGRLSKFLSALPFRSSERRASGSNEASECLLVTMAVCTPFNDMVTDILDPAEVKKHFDRIGHFRILVLGRSNAGKTTLLQRVCNTTELPEIFNAKGEKVKPSSSCRIIRSFLMDGILQMDPTIVQGSLEVNYPTTRSLFGDMN